MMYFFTLGFVGSGMNFVHVAKSHTQCCGVAVLRLFPIAVNIKEIFYIYIYIYIYI